MHCTIIMYVTYKLLDCSYNQFLVLCYNVLLICRYISEIIATVLIVEFIKNKKERIIILSINKCAKTYTFEEKKIVLYKKYILTPIKALIR